MGMGLEDEVARAEALASPISVDAAAVASGAAGRMAVQAASGDAESWLVCATWTALTGVVAAAGPAGIALDPPSAAAGGDQRRQQRAPQDRAAAGAGEPSG